MNTLFNYNNAWIDLQNILLPQYVTFYDYYDNEVPVCSTTDVGILTEGVCFTISGFMLPNCERFSISFVLGNATRDIALRINPRLPQNYVVRNSRINNIWGIDEDATVYPFTLRRGTDFVIQVLLTERRYMISLNGDHFAKYRHRVPYKYLARIEVHGDVSKVSINRSEVTRYPDRLSYDRARYIPERRASVFGLRPMFNRFTASRICFTDFHLPFYGLLPPNSLSLTQHLRIEGRVKLLPWSFYINLQEGQNVWPHPIVPFHFQCRFARHRNFVTKNVITRTAWIGGKWVKEEVTEPTTDLRPAKDFSLVIARGLKSFEVYVNKNFIVDFEFIVNPDKVDTVLVVGDIQLYDIMLEGHDPEIFYHPRMSIDFIDILDDLI